VPIIGTGGQDPFGGFYIEARAPKKGDDLDALLADPRLDSDGDALWRTHKSGVLVFAHSDLQFFITS
jgi:H2-forming N5,N10-methylenetetrahydromethanopterin dehydrogenase-like enzyme